MILVGSSSGTNADQLRLMTPDEAAWVREHVWTGFMRSALREGTRHYSGCGCQFGVSSSCRDGQHRGCIRASPHPTPESYITDLRAAALQFAAPYEHPMRWAGGYEYAGPDARVWFADRVCRWVCPCDCHATPAEPSTAVFEPVALFDLPQLPSKARTR